MRLLPWRPVAPRALVGGEVAEDDDVVPSERRRELLLDIGLEEAPAHRPNRLSATGSPLAFRAVPKADQW